MDKIQNISGQIRFQYLTYYFKSRNLAPINFFGFRGPLNIYKRIKNGDVSIEKAEKIKSN